MGAVSRFAGNVDKRCAAGVTSACRELDTLLAALEQFFVEGGAGVQDLIVVSFLETVAEDVVASRDFESRFGPVLRREIQVYRTSTYIDSGKVTGKSPTRLALLEGTSRCRLKSCADKNSAIYLSSSRLQRRIPSSMGHYWR